MPIFAEYSQDIVLRLQSQPVPGHILVWDQNLQAFTNGIAADVGSPFLFPQTDGTAGQVLATDGAGNLTFVTVTGGVASTGDIRFDGSWIKNVDTGNIYISPQDGNTWLTLPSDSQAGSGPVNLGNSDANGVVQITAGNIYKNWTFSHDGNLTLTNGSIIKDSNGTLSQGPAVDTQNINDTIGVFHGLNFTPPNGIAVGWTVNGPGVNNAQVFGLDTVNGFVEIDSGVFQVGESYTFTGPAAGVAGINVTVNNNNWAFGTDGVLKLPDTTTVAEGFINGGPDNHTAGISTYSGWNQVYAQDSDAAIQTSADGITFKTWTFGTDGSITLPLGGYITAPSAMGSNTVIQAPVSNRALLQNSDGTNLVAADDQGVAMTTVRGTVQFGYNLEAPGVPSHFHINKLDQTFDLFFGDDANYFHLPASGGAPVIGATNTGVVGANTYLWTFGQDGKLTFPDESQQSFAPSTGVGPLNPWGTPFPSGVGVAGTDYQFFFDISNSGRPSIQSYSPNGGYPLYNTIWNIQLYSTALVGNDSSGATPVQVNNTGGVNLCDPIGPGDCAIVRVQNLDTGRVYRATFLGSYNVADTGNETKYGSIIVERLV